MTDETTTTATSRSLFGWSSPGRNIAIILVVVPFIALLLAAWWSGAL